MNNIDWTVYLTITSHSISTLVFILDSTDRRLAEILEVSYHDKYSMKLIGGTAFSFRSKMRELVILGLSKTVEDLLSAIKKFEKKEYRFWHDFDGLKHVDKAKMIRNLSNVIKHHGGVIDTSAGIKDCDELVNVYGFPNNFLIGDWGESGARPDSCLYKNTFWIEQFCLHLISSHCGTEDLTSDIDDNLIKEYITKKWVGDYFELESNKSLE